MIVVGIWVIASTARDITLLSLTAGELSIDIYMTIVKPQTALGGVRGPQKKSPCTPLGRLYKGSIGVMAIFTYCEGQKAFLEPHVLTAGV